MAVGNQIHCLVVWLRSFDLTFPVIHLSTTPAAGEKLCCLGAGVAPEVTGAQQHSAPAPGQCVASCHVALHLHHGAASMLVPGSRGGGGQ